MKLMRKYRVFVCAVLILCFFSFHISRPRQALAIVPAVSLAAAAVLAVGAAAGLSYTFDNADAESIAGRLQAFLDDVHPGTAITDYFSARGAAVKDGLMYIGRSLYNRIKEFLQWEVSDNELAESSSVVVSSSNAGFVTIDSISIDFTSYQLNGQTVSDNDDDTYVSSAYSIMGGGTVYNFSVSSLGDLASDLVIKVSENCWMKFSVERQNLVYYSSIDGGLTYNHDYTASLNSTRNYHLGFVYCSNGNNEGIDCFLPVVYHNISNGYQLDFRKPLNRYWPFTSAQMDSTVSISDSFSLSLTASDVISYPEVSEGQSVCVDVGMLTGSTIDEVSDEIIDAAIDGTLSPSISAETWTVDVVTTPQELAQDLDQDLTTDVEDNPTVPDTERIEFDPPAHYTVRDLRTFFPFCIPFDLFDMLGVLAAQPVAPHFEYRFQPGIANIDYTIVIDFQQFDSVALLLRRLETLSFCIGLAMVTRNLIRG